MKKIIFFILLIFLFFCCARDSEIVSYNLSKDADMFNVYRRVVFYNGITGDYILVIEGLCSISVDVLQGQLELTVKTGNNSYKKHFLGLSDNVTYFAEQIESNNTDRYHYQVIFKPASIMPTIKIEQ